MAKKRTKKHKGVTEKSQKIRRLERGDFFSYTEKLYSFFSKDIFTFGLFKKRKKFVYLISVFSIAMFGIFMTLILLAAATYAYFSQDISNPNTLINRNNTGAVIYSRDGETLYEMFGAKYRKMIDIENIPPHLEEATISIEDKDFYKHSGVNTRGMARALYVNFKAKEMKEGGSSITQQLVKNALLNPKKSFVRKYQEIVLALEIERRYSKEDIMKMYLNEIYYGEGAWGIEDAAEVYYRKEAKDLDLAEVAMLAGLPKAPSTYSPINNIEEAKKRQREILNAMVKQGYITDKDSETALAKELTFYGPETEIKAPHFVMYVLEEMKREYGEEMMEKGGLRIHTTLDYKKQQEAEEVLRKNLEKLRGQNATNGSLVSMDPKNGDILALVGSKDWSNEQWGKVNVSETEQQPGSSFKPFVYTKALEKGWTANTKIKDSPITYPGTPPYSPKNYDGKFHGNVTMRKALSNSFNVPAVKALEFAGVDETIDFAKEAGITGLNDRSRYGLSLVLGGGDVKLMDMTSAFGTFANQGVYKKPRTIEKVLNKKGKNITKRMNNEGKKVIDPGYTFIISDILADNDARKEVFGPNSPLKLSRQAAAKTGTTEENRDAWTMGYTPNLVTGVWVGNNDNSKMNSIAGASGAAPIWHDYMEKALSDMPVEKFQKPSNVVEKWIWDNGKVAKAETKGARREYFMQGTEPQGKSLEDEKPDKNEKPKEKEVKPVDPKPVVPITPQPPAVVPTPPIQTLPPVEKSPVKPPDTPPPVITPVPNT